MKFTCNQQKLSSALSIVSKSITNRSTLPILKGFLLEVDKDNNLIISGSDLDLSIEHVIKVDNAEQGSIVVESKNFNELIKKLYNSEIIIEVLDDLLYVKCGNESYTIPIMSADEFPRINFLENFNDTITIDKNLFRDMIKKTIFASGSDDIRPILKGLLIDVNNNTLSAVASDGFRIALYRNNVNCSVNKSIIINSRIISEINKIIAEVDTDEENIIIELNDKKALFKLKDIKVMSSLIEGNFIDYKSLMFDDFETEVIIDRSELFSTVDKASIFSNISKSKSIKLEVKDDIMIVSSSSSEGSSNNTINIEKKGNDILIGCNSKYILEPLKNIEDGTIKIIFKNNQRPFIIKSVSGEEYNYLLAPLRI